MKPSYLIAFIIVAIGLVLAGTNRVDNEREMGQRISIEELEQGDVGTWHQVIKGETLRGISRQYYGNPRDWRTIQIANDVGHVPRVGTLLWIPDYHPELDQMAANVSSANSQPSPNN